MHTLNQGRVPSRLSPFQSFGEAELALQSIFSSELLNSHPSYTPIFNQTRRRELCGTCCRKICLVKYYSTVWKRPILSLPR